MDIYRRIYRLATKNVPANQIAVTLGLPLSNVKDILKRLSADPSQSLKTDSPTEPDDIDESEGNPTSDDSRYLDVYIMQQSRVTVVDITGYAIEKNKFKLKIELNRVDKMEAKIFGLQMNSLYEMEPCCYELIKALHADFTSRSRFLAILDPSRPIEKFITENNVEKDIPVFGTVSALERSAGQMNSGR